MLEQQPLNDRFWLQHTRMTHHLLSSKISSQKKYFSLGGLALSGVMALTPLGSPAIAQTQVPTTQPSSTLPGLTPTPTQPGGLLKPGSPRLLPPLPTSGPIQSPVVDASYTLGAGDRVRIDIFNVPEYSGEYNILSDGTLNLPLVGGVSVSGMTLQQASTELGAKYTRFLKRPIVTVTVLATRPLKVAIAGEVDQPGSYTIGAGEGAGLPTVTRVIQLAGGITQAADIRNIQVRRLRPRNSGTETLNLDLWQLLRSGDLSQDILLRDGDTILIPTNQGVNIAESSQLASASFATKESRPIRIAVVGEVNRPGPYTISGGTDAAVGVSGVAAGGGTSAPPLRTVTRAIQIAGGITQSADIRNIQIRRLTKAGTEQLIAVNFWDLLQSGDLKQDVPLQEGDTVVIPTARQLSGAEATKLATTSFSPDKINVNIVGEVVRPGAVPLPPNTPLTQAVLAAGGFNNRADQGSVQLIRLNPNGTVSQRGIPVNLAEAVNDNTNPPLRNNDTIIVGKSGFAGFGDTVGNILSPILSPITGIFSILRLFGR